MIDAISKLVESGAISEDVQKGIQEAWDLKIKENREGVSAELREEFAKRYEHDKANMIEAIDNMMALASETEHPRAFEVLAGMFKTTTDMMDQLITLQKKRKELTQSEGQKPGESGNTTNNAIFVGSTTELQKFLSNNNDNN